MSAQGPRRRKDALAASGGGLRIDILALGIFALALSARLVHLWALRASPFFSQLLVDSVDFDVRAMSFLDGTWYEEGAFYQAPFYPLFLSGLYRIFGHDLLAPRIAQAILGSGTAALIYLVGRRCCGKAVGVIAGIIAALYSMAIHFDGEILRPSLVIFLAVLSIHILMLASQKGGALRWAGAGFVLGLASITRPTLLVFLPLAALWILFGRRPFRVATAAAAICIGCALVPIAAVTALNYARSGAFVLISYNGGINFFIGNNPEYERTVGIRPGIRWDLLTSEPPVDRRSDPSGWSRYYYGKAAEYIASEPAGWAALTLKKFVLFWNGHEIERNVDFSHAASYSPFMAHPLVSFRWVGPLALVGMIMAWRRKAPLGLLALYFISQMTATVAFFVVARYRMIAMPALWVFAAYGAVVLYRELRRRPLGAAPYLCIGAVAALGVNLDAYNISETRYARSDYEVALVLRREGRTRECLSLLERIEAERPDDPDPPFQRGVTLAGGGRYAEAAMAFEEAARREPGYARTWFNLGLSLARADRAAQASESYRRALEVEPGYWEAAFGLGEALEKLGRLDEAAVAYRRAGRLARDSRGAAASEVGLARIEASGGSYQQALGHLDSAIVMDPGFLEARLARARVLKAMGSVNEAVLEAERAERLAPADARVRALLDELRR